MCVDDLMKIVKSGDADKNYKKLRDEINKLDDEEKEELLVRAIYALDALSSIKIDGD